MQSSDDTSVSVTPEEINGIKTNDGNDEYNDDENHNDAVIRDDVQQFPIGS